MVSNTKLSFIKDKLYQRPRFLGYYPTDAPHRAPSRATAAIRRYLLSYSILQVCNLIKANGRARKYSEIWCECYFIVHMKLWENGNILNTLMFNQCSLTHEWSRLAPGQQSSSGGGGWEVCFSTYPFKCSPPNSILIGFCGQTEGEKCVRLLAF